MQVHDVLDLFCIKQDNCGLGSALDMFPENWEVSGMHETKTAKVFKKAARWQLIATVAVAVAAFFLKGVHGALSALAGGGAAIAGGYAASLVAGRSEQNKEAGAILINLLKAEAVKILVIVILLWITFKTYAGNLVPMALIFGLAAAALLSGAAMSALNDKR